MSYQLYRNTTIGNTLQETFDEQISNGYISAKLASKSNFLKYLIWCLNKKILLFQVLDQFDKSINMGLSSKVKTCISFKAS